MLAVVHLGGSLLKLLLVSCMKGFHYFGKFRSACSRSSFPSGFNITMYHKFSGATEDR